MKNVGLYLISISFLLASCDTVYFTSTSPKDGVEIKGIPNELNGLYYPSSVDFNALKIENNNLLFYSIKKSETKCLKIFEEKNSRLFKKGNRYYWNKYDSLAKGYSITVAELSEGNKILNIYILFPSYPYLDKIDTSSFKSQRLEFKREYIMDKNSGKKGSSDVRSILVDLEDASIDDFIDELKPEIVMTYFRNIEDVPKEMVDQLGMDSINTIMQNVRAAKCK